jgi:hypothetical protein
MLGQLARSVRSHYTHLRRVCVMGCAQTNDDEKRDGSRSPTVLASVPRYGWRWWIASGMRGYDMKVWYYRLEYDMRYMLEIKKGRFFCRARGNYYGITHCKV